MTERVATWAYRVNEGGFRIGGFSGVVRVREARNGRWAWRERFRCGHDNHLYRLSAINCAEVHKSSA